MSGYIGNIPVPQATQTRDRFTAASGQTTFATSGYTPGFLDVYLNGVHLDESDYTATNGSDVVLDTGAATDDIVEVVAFTTFTPANIDAVSAANGGTFSGAVTFTDAFTSRGIDDNATSTAMTLDASGNLLVSKTAGGSGTAGVQLEAGGRGGFTKDNAYVTFQNRLSSDGEISRFMKDGTTVGSIASSGGTDLAIGSGDTGFRFIASANEIIPWNASGNTTNGDAIDIGKDTQRFKDLYLSGGVYLGGTSSTNYLNDYEDGNWTPQVTIGGSNVTTTSTRNAYQIIGNYVFIEANITFASGTNTGAIKITGLPTAVTTTSTFQRGIMTNDYFDNPERYYWYAYTGSQLELRVGGTSQSTGSRDLNGNDVKDNSNLVMYIGGWYKTR